MIENPTQTQDWITQMNKTKIVKFATSAIVGAGTSTVTDSIIKNNVNYDALNRFGVLQVTAARIVIGLIAAKKTKEYTDAAIDDFVARLETTKSDTTETPTAV